MRRSFAASASLALLATSACGHYGPPVRAGESQPPVRTEEVQAPPPDPWAGVAPPVDEEEKNQEPQP